MAALTVSGGGAGPSSSFRESDWDRKLDNLLDDLESSGRYQTASSSYGQSSSGHHQVRQQQQQRYAASSSSSSQQQRSQSASSAQRSQKLTSSSSGNVGGSNLANGYSIAKSQSTNSLHEGADTMLKDLEDSLKASSNYIESHRTVNLPHGTREYHEYRSYSSGGNNGVSNGGNLDDYNLERQVQHMMPQGSFGDRSGLSSSNYSSGLQSANMVSNMQQSNQSYSAYKVQSNQYSSTGDRITTTTTTEDQERPGSRLKQNIDELDTLLYDLNNARKMSDAGADYTASSITPGNMSSDDYSFNEGHQGHVKKTVHTYNEHTYQGGDYSSKKPPSPSPRRRGPAPLSSPSSVRRVSPGPSSRRPNEPSAATTYNYSSSYSSNQQSSYQPPQTTTYSYTTNYNPPPPPATTNDTNLTPSQPLPSDGNPTGVTYYTKYHSTHSHQSQGNGPASFPSNSTPRPAPKTQTPPKRVDDLFSELSEFDSSIQHTGFVEPAPTKPYTDRDPAEFRNYRDPSPPRAKQATQVYYPPAKAEGLTHSTTLDGGKGKAKGEYSYKSKSKEKSSEGEGKQGAAVIPICLPMCCAAPCVIM